MGRHLVLTFSKIQAYDFSNPNSHCIVIKLFEERPQGKAYFIPPINPTLLDNKTLSFLQCSCLIQTAHLMFQGVFLLWCELLLAIFLFFVVLLLHLWQYPNVRHCTQRTEEYLEHSIQQ
jgi:hypothetical protein